jgi:hypothetical protein
MKLRLRSNSDHFQVLSENRGRTLTRSILRRPQRFKLPAKALSSGGIEGSKRQIGRPIVETEKLDYLRGRKRIAERVMAPDQG